MNTSKATGSFAEAWQLLYRARTLFAILLLLAMVVNIAVLLTVRFTGLVDPLIKKQVFGSCSPVEGPAPTSGPIERTDTSNIESAHRYVGAFQAVMTLTNGIAIVAVIFMMFCALVGVMTLIAAHLPGAGAMVGGFFWALAAAAFMLPWQRLLAVPVGLLSFDDLLNTYRDACTASSWYPHMTLWVQFVLYPLVLILFTVMYLGRTSQAHAQMSAGSAATTE